MEVEQKSIYRIMFLNYFFRVLPLTSYFYLIYILSFASMASCGSDFHSVVALYVKKLISSISNLLSDAGVWEIANTLWLFDIVSYLCTLPLLVFFQVQVL